MSRIIISHIKNNNLLFGLFSFSKKYHPLLFSPPLNFLALALTFDF
jgi:hypothetical protein